MLITSYGSSLRSSYKTITHVLASTLYLCFRTSLINTRKLSESPNSLSLAPNVRGTATTLHRAPLQGFTVLLCNHAAMNVQVVDASCLALLQCPCAVLYQRGRTVPASGSWEQKRQRIDIRTVLWIDATSVAFKRQVRAHSHRQHRGRVDVSNMSHTRQTNNATHRYHCSVDENEKRISPTTISAAYTKL